MRGGSKGGRSAPVAALMIAALLPGCYEQSATPRSASDGTTSDPTSPHDPVDELAELVEALSDGVDLRELLAERVEYSDGTFGRRWFHDPIYAYDPATLRGQGVSLIDTSSPLVLDPERPNRLFVDLDEDGNPFVAGVGWVGHKVGEEPPELLGVPMEMATNGPHEWWELNLWLWLPSELNDHGWFGAFNQAMTVPSWYLENEPHLLGLARFFDPVTAAALGYQPAGSCIEGADGDVGYPLTQPELVGLLDPGAPDTVLETADREVLGVQWTWPAEAGPPPTLFGQDLDGPHADGTFTLRMWSGRHFNPVNFFHPTLPGFSCADAAGG